MPIHDRVQKLKRFLGRPANPSDGATRVSRASSAPLVPNFLRGNSTVQPLPDQEAIGHQIVTPVVPRLVIAFVKQLTKEKLSHFLIWFFYHDLVDLPVSPAEWYSIFSSVELKGWITLGSRLQHSSGSGSDVFKINGPISQLGLSRKVVRSILMELANPERMRFSRLSHIIRAAERENLPQAEMLDRVQANLIEGKHLVECLRPALDTTFAAWQQQILESIQDFLTVIVHPRLSQLRGGIEVMTGRTEKEENHVRYLFEVMQQERPVPLIRYGIFPADSIDSYVTSLSSGDYNFANLPDPMVNAEQEKSWTPSRLLSEYRKLQTEFQELKRTTEHLKTSREAHQMPPVIDPSKMPIRRPLPPSEVPLPQSPSEETGEQHLTPGSLPSDAFPRRSADVVLSVDPLPPVSPGKSRARPRSTGDLLGRLHGTQAVNSKPLPALPDEAPRPPPHRTPLSLRPDDTASGPRNYPDSSVQVPPTPTSVMKTGRHSRGYTRSHDPTVSAISLRTTSGGSSRTIMDRPRPRVSSRTSDELHFDAPTVAPPRPSFHEGSEDPIDEFNPSASATATPFSTNISLSKRFPGTRWPPQPTAESVRSSSSATTVIRISDRPTAAPAPANEPRSLFEHLSTPRRTSTIRAVPRDTPPNFSNMRDSMRPPPLFAHGRSRSTTNLEDRGGGRRGVGGGVRRMRSKSFNDVGGLGG